jgi:hypothetical protein
LLHIPSVTTCFSLVITRLDGLGPDIFSLSESSRSTVERSSLVVVVVVVVGVGVVLLGWRRSLYKISCLLLLMAGDKTAVLWW